jgi:uncharacterized membrane protein
VSQFVEERRREWKRLRVPSALADEMADDLAADLREAEADGASEEEVLGSPASDPRAFAAAWASERGIVRPRRSDRLRKRWLVVLASLALFVVLVIAAGLIASLSSSESSAPRAAIGVAPTVVPGAIIGTSIFGAGVLPSNVALSTGKRTVLNGRPRSIAITFGNTGGQIVELAHLTVQIGLNHTYQFTARHMVPNSPKTVRIALPADLPSKFKVPAVTRPVPGEANTQNNERIWRVTIE